MDETNSATSSSAAAVADGASAAATTKKIGVVTSAPSPSSNSAKINPNSIKLLIKASNQQYADQIIESDLLWTVKRLKSHLTVVYPSKPPSAEQKLIYSGQLLNDSLLLKDVIRSYKDVYTQNHIIHLVYTPKNLPPSNLNAKTKATTTTTTGTKSTTQTMSSSDSGLRQRHTATTAAAASDHQQQQQQQQPSQQNVPFYTSPQFMAAFGQQQYTQSNVSNVGSGLSSSSAFGHQYNIQNMATQQMAMYNWMQYVYSQYMEQCLRLSNTVNNGAENPTGNSMPTSFPTMNSFYQNFPFNAHNGIPNAFLATVPNPHSSMPSAAAMVAHGEEVLPPQEHVNPQPAQAQVAGPRFPNIQQEEQENRDWLDNFFSITRLAIFLTLLYFNSSPLRCLAVVLIAGGIYLYHIGIIRIRQERNNNNLNRNNNAAQNAAVDQIRQGLDQQQQQPQQEQPQNADDVAAAAAAEENPLADNQNNAANIATNNDNTATPHNTNSDVNNPQDNESIMSTLRTFVVTFFTSLLPETPAL